MLSLQWRLLLLALLGFLAQLLGCSMRKFQQLRCIIMSRNSPSGLECHTCRTCLAGPCGIELSVPHSRTSGK